MRVALALIILRNQPVPLLQAAPGLPGELHLLPVPLSPGQHVAHLSGLLVKEEDGGEPAALSSFGPAIAEGQQGVEGVPLPLSGDGFLRFHGYDVVQGGAVAGAQGIAAVPGEVLHPHPGLVGDGDGQVPLLRDVEVLTVVHRPLGSRAAEHVVVRLHKHIHPAGGQQGQVVLPVVLVVGKSLGTLVPQVALHRPGPGKVVALQTDQPGAAFRKALVHAVVGIQQAVLPILLEGGDIRGAVVGPLLVRRSGELPGLPVHHPDEQGIAQPVGIGGRPQQVVPLLNGGQQAGLIPLLPDGLVLCRQQGQQLFLLLGQGDSRGLRLTGHQPSAQQSQGAGQDQKQDRRALLLVLEDISDTLLRLPGRAGQGGGEGSVRRRGFGHIKHLKLN